MAVKRKIDSVDQVIHRIKEGKLAEFGRLDLPLEVQVMARNRAAMEGLTTKQALNLLISEAGGLSKLSKEARRAARKIRRKSARVVAGGAAKGFFGATSLLRGAPAMQGGSPGNGKS